MCDGRWKTIVYYFTDCSSGSYQRNVGEKQFGEISLFTRHLSFEEARKYKNCCGGILRQNQWKDIEVEDVMLL